jgi:peptidoglycan hydrolase FlgJ
MNVSGLDANVHFVPYGAPARIKPIQHGDRIRAQAEDFETVFVSSMFQHMFTAIGNDGPLGNAPGVGAWRSMLTEQFARSFVKAGGLGLADKVYKSMLARQAATNG